MTKTYIDNNFEKIVKYENIIEKRKLSAKLKKEKLIKENEYNLEMCKKYNNEYILIDKDYKI